MLTFQDLYTKTQRLAQTSNATDLTQIKQDINTGYHMFNARLSRYFSRKQQFTNLIANQGTYQVPIDSVRVLVVTALVTPTYEVPLKEIRSEFEWRQITSYKTLASNWPTFYFAIGNDEIALWPVPSQSVTNGMRFVYQPQDHDLTLDDITSNSTGTTVTVTNGSPTVTNSGTPFNADLASLQLQITGITDTSWYEIVSSTTSVLTLKSAYVASSGSGKAWRIGQVSIIPQEYQDAPMHYALGNFFSAKGNEARSNYHLGSKDKPGVFYQMIEDCLEDYSSSNESSVITEDDYFVNAWSVPPQPNQ